MPQPHLLSDAEFTALLPHILPASPRGRQIGELRARLDAIFAIGNSAAPWRALETGPAGRPDTVARHFRRLAHAGAIHRLLIAAANARPGEALHDLRDRLCRVARRAIRIGGLPLIALIRRLGLTKALPAPPWLLPDPNLSETLRRIPPANAATAKPLARLLRAAAGRRKIPRILRLLWW
jgi:transposase